MINYNENMSRESKKRYKTIRTVIMVPILLLFAFFLTTVLTINYLNTRNELLQNFEVLKSQILNSTVSAIRLVDESKKALEISLDEKLQAMFPSFIEEYERAERNPYKMNLRKLREDLGGDIHLFVINKEGIIIRTTEPKDLDFQLGGDTPFGRKLIEILHSNKYYPDRLVIGNNTGILTKWAYHPTPDNQYILELGLDARNINYNIEKSHISAITDYIVSQYREVLDIRILGSSYWEDVVLEYSEIFIGKGFSGVKSPQLADLVKLLEEQNKDGENFIINNGNEQKQYIYVNLSDPYFVTNEKYVVEIIFTREIIEKKLSEQLIFSLIVITLSLITGFILIAFVSTRLSSPIHNAVLSVQQIARGDLQHRLDTDSKNEFSILESNINSMVGTLQEAHTSLKSNEQYLYQIINSLPSILICVDENLKITLWNRMAQIETGIHFAEAKGKSLPSLVSDMAFLEDHIRKAMKDNRKIELAIQVKELNDRLIYRETTIYPLEGDSMKGAIIRTDDITERVKSDMDKVQSEKMLSIGGLAEGMAHEINNPLAGIVQTVGVMKERLFNRDLSSNQKASEKAGLSLDHLEQYLHERGIERMIGNVESSSVRVGEIIGTILGFSSLSDGKQSGHDLRLLMDKAIEIASSESNLKDKYQFREIPISKNYEKDIPIVRCEESKIVQVFLNILLNAAQAIIDADADNPRMTVSISSLEKEESVLVKIKDNGIGMDPHTSKRVFEPFFTTRTEKEAKGLGMSIAYFILNNEHKGSIEVESASGSGTTVRMRIPC